ncbi:MAG: hypothetical protein J6V66_06265 [Clostridia bacterium]|nr:hypothetical protein [Clostridia bacterium]
MKKTIYCRTVAKGVQAFYVEVERKRYFLFNQKYYAGVRNCFRKGIDFNLLSSACKSNNFAVRRTANKLKNYLKYIENEYCVVIYDKRVKQMSIANRKRELFREYACECAYRESVLESA